MAIKMGFQGVMYYDVVGTNPAATQITNRRDVNITLEPEKGNTTVAGDGSAPPINTEQVCALGWSIEWTMVNDTSDTTLEALRAAAAAGTAVALRLKDYSSGKGFNGDVTLSVRHGKPLKGEQTYVFTATPTREIRTPQLYV